MIVFAWVCRVTNRTWTETKTDDEDESNNILLWASDERSVVKLQWPNYSGAIWRSGSKRWFALAEMPVRAVTSRFMYRGLCSIPDLLSYRTPVTLPEDEVEGEWYFMLSYEAALSVAIVLSTLKMWISAPWRDPHGSLSCQDLQMKKVMSEIVFVICTLVWDERCFKICVCCIEFGTALQHSEIKCLVEFKAQLD